MQNTFKGRTNIRHVADNLQRISEATNRMFRSHTSNTMQWMGELQDAMGSMGISSWGKKKDHCGACPPECDCPPKCLLSIDRTANEGEVIVVLFRVKNRLQMAKSYKIGVRPICDDQGNPLGSQPGLDKTAINLQPGQGIVVGMKIDLSKDYHAGHSYSTEIVIREEGGKVNQNICFMLFVTSNTDIPEADPLDECCYFDHFQDWKSHYYCDKPVRQKP